MEISSSIAAVNGTHLYRETAGQMTSRGARSPLITDHWLLITGFASQSERRGPRQITEWQVVRLHRLAPTNGGSHASHAQTGAVARSRDRTRSVISPDRPGIGLLTRAQEVRALPGSPTDH